ncbi:MAG: TOBE domain-containing protein [Elusimicrobia bacterium]|nr:TOBE domain-containing protein [Elusimicrobiota bacterium]
MCPRLWWHKSRRTLEKIIFGIRPEDLYDRLFYNYPVVAGSSVVATVDVVEPLGPEIFLYLKAGSVDLVARVPAYVKAQEGKKMDLVFNLERMHLFDSETKKALLNPELKTFVPPAPVVKPLAV